MTNSLQFWQVDAFTAQPFKGNPAAIFILQDNLGDSLMQNIALEMNLSETAYILLREGQNPLLRWFTPTMEIDLCGHATLASAHIFLNETHPDLQEVTFDTKVAGPLTVKKTGAEYCMDFPTRAGDKVDIDTLPDFVLDALSSEKPKEAYQARDLMLVYEDENIIRNINPDFNSLKAYEDFIIVTSASHDPAYDFVSRFFCADDGISEDPVTGSAHCTLTPYWSDKLGKTKLKAYQASQRGGSLNLEISGERTLISGAAITVMDGQMRI